MSYTKKGKVYSCEKDTSYDELMQHTEDPQLNTFYMD